MPDFLSSTLILGFAAAGFAFVLRALAPISLLMRKPLSCDLCMSWWSTWLFGLLCFRPLPMASLALASCFAAIAVSMLVLKVVRTLDEP